MLGQPSANQRRACYMGVASSTASMSRDTSPSKLWPDRCVSNACFAHDCRHIRVRRTKQQYSTKPGTNPSWGVQRRQAAARHPGVVGHRCERPGNGLRQHGQRLCHRCWVAVPCGCFPVASVSATAVRAWFAHSSLRKRTGFMMQTSWDLQWCI